MNVYLETSALLRDLLEGEHAEAIREVVRSAEVVATSRLTLAETGRVLARLRVLEPSVAARIAAREAQLWSDTDLWFILPVDEAVWERCGRPFPEEPVRVLDALHLASVEVLSGQVPGLVVVSTDDRIRRNAAELGFEIVPRALAVERE